MLPLLLIITFLTSTTHPVFAQAVQRGAQPDPQDVRPGNAEGDSPSAAAGQVQRDAEPRLLGLPRHAAVTVGVVLAALIVASWLLRSRRRAFRRSRR
jgi:hypothetical protein